MSELNPQPEMLAPFEGMGVDQIWEFSMPKASNCSTTWGDGRVGHDRVHGAGQLRLPRAGRQATRPSARRRPTSCFRHQFADAWYDLHNPELFDDEQERMVVRFRTARDDFPPNIEALAISHVAFYFGATTDQTRGGRGRQPCIHPERQTVTSSSMTSANWDRSAPPPTGKPRRRDRARPHR